MSRIKLVVAYDGTNYCGWQTQKNGKSVEAELNRALSGLCREDIAVIGASRTDSGVHALGNVAVFDTESRIPAEKFSFALNQRLPDDIRIQESCLVADEFHPRRCRSVKTYEYRILNRQFEIPTARLYSVFVHYPLDADKMNRAAQTLVGEHDFKSFCCVRTQALSTVRTIREISVTRDGDMVVIRVSGYGFLYNMVRIIAGTLMNIGLGLWDEDSIKRILDACDRTVAGPTAEAKGLTLVGIEYLL